MRSTLAAIILFFLPVLAWAGVHPGDRVSLPSFDFSFSGNGVSVDEFMNSLTDINGLLRSIQMHNHGRVTFDSQPSIQGNHIYVPLTYHLFWGHQSDAAGTLKALPYNGCPSGERGKELELVSDNTAPIRIKESDFLVCAKPAGDSVLVHIGVSLVAGPQWVSEALDIAKVMFSGLPDAVQRHAVIYASETSSDSGSRSGSYQSGGAY